MPVRVLLLADTHLGFDHPVRPRVHRRRRGPEFLASYRRALSPAMAGRVDLVVHAGDVFHRSRVPATLAVEAFDPLRQVADRGIPVVVVPGNHERSRLPHLRYLLHPGIHVLDQPRTVRLRIDGHRVSLTGFPYQRKDVRGSFPSLLSEAGWRPGEADVSLLCVHHCFEGAKVGPVDYTFRHGEDVIPGAAIPWGMAAVLTGHVHRHQLLRRDLAGRPLPAPVLYPGSTERTAFAERSETKGYVVLEVEGGGRDGGGTLADWTFHELPTRPMVEAELPSEGLDWREVQDRLEGILDTMPRDAILRLRVRGHPGTEAREILSAPSLRAMASPTMNVEVVWVDEPRAVRRP